MSNFMITGTLKGLKKNKYPIVDTLKLQHS